MQATSGEPPTREIPPPVPARSRAGRWWIDLSLRRKLLSIAVLITVVCVPPIVLGLALDLRVDDARRESQQTADAIDDLAELQDRVLVRGAGAATPYVIGGLSEPRYVADYRGAVAALPGLLGQLDDDVPADLGEPLARVTTTYEALPDALDPVMLRSQISPDDLAAASDATTAAFDASSRLGAALDERVTAQRDEVARLQGRLTWATLTGLVLTLVAAAGGIYLVTKGLVRRIEQLSANASRFIQDQPVLEVTRSRDEIGQLNDVMSFAGGQLDARRNAALAATRAKDDFLARVSHELKTPLTAVLGYARLLETDPDLTPADREDAAQIVTAGRHLQRLIEELLDIRAIEAGKLALAIEAVPLHETADDALALVRSMAAGRSITVSVDCPPDVAVAADRRRLREVLLNLLSNAVKHNRPGGHVDVTADVTDGRVRVSVADTGPGISRDGQERMFRPFERLGAGTTDTEGSGVGLALTKHVVEAMGGTIGVTSEVGEGSTFWIDLPAADSLAALGTGPGGGPARAASAPRDDSRSAPAVPVGATTGEEARPERVPPVLPRSVPARTRVGRWWMDMSLRHKLLSIVVLITLVCAPPVVVGLVVNDRVTDARDARRQSQAADDALTDLHDTVLLRGHRAIQSYVIGGFGDPDQLAPYETAVAEYPRLRATLEDETPAGLDEPLAEVVAAYEALLPRLAVLASQGPDTTIDASLVQGLAASDAATKAAFAADGRLTDALNQRIVDQRADVDRLRQQLVWAMIASLVAALVAAGAGLYLVTNGIVRRIEQHAANATRFIQGEPVEVVTRSRDEIGQFDDSISYAAELLEARRAEALAASRAKDEFLSRVSHELKTPLTAIIGFAQLLEESPDLPPDRRQDAAEIVGGAGHLRELIEELLDIKAIEAGRLTLSIESVPLCRTADDALAVVRRMAADRSITITADCPADILVAADRRRLRDVLINLLSNAVKYNREGGRVELVADRRDGTVHVAVTDTGPGIAPDEHKHLFEPFERLPATTGTEGSGVGLALAKHVVEAMGGTIGVDSEVGEGSTFWFDLPVADTGPGPPVGRPGTDPALGTP